MITLNHIFNRCKLINIYGEQTMFIGILLLLMGALMLLSSLGVINADFGEYILPVILVALGVSFILKDKKERR